MYVEISKSFGCSTGRFVLTFLIRHPAGFFPIFQELKRRLSLHSHYFIAHNRARPVARRFVERRGAKCRAGHVGGPFFHRFSIAHGRAPYKLILSILTYFTNHYEKRGLKRRGRKERRGKKFKKLKEQKILN